MKVVHPLPPKSLYDISDNELPPSTHCMQGEPQPKICITETLEQMTTTQMPSLVRSSSDVTTDPLCLMTLPVKAGEEGTASTSNACRKC
jgi:hypothetical protein